MSFIRKKTMKSGITYAYQVTQMWDREKKQPRQISIYLGVVGADGLIKPKGTVPRGRPKQTHPRVVVKEKLIVDFGDGFLASESIKRSAIYEPLSECWQHYPGLLALMTYRLCCPGPMYNCEAWLAGNIVGLDTSTTQLSSQAISRLLVKLGDEALQRRFFKRYLQMGSSATRNVIIDATSLPNQSHTDFNAWGYSEGAIEQQFRFHCVVDQDTQKPLFYRYVAGNINDVSTLKATIEELNALGVSHHFALLDAGYCSAENLAQLRKHHIDFLTRLPAGRRLYKTLIVEHAPSMEVYPHLIVYGQRTLFVKRVALDGVYGDKGYVYLILDPDKKNKTIQALGLKHALNRAKTPPKHDKITYQLAAAGIVMLMSSKPIPTHDIMQAYYTRQSIEQIFGFSKSELEILPIRHHSQATIRGYLFLQFLLLIVFIELREKLKGTLTVEQAFLLLKTLKCKIYDDKRILQELTKKQKQVFQLCSILVPN